MGNSCSCLNDLSEGNLSQIEIEESIISKNKVDLRTLIKLQSLMRGFIDRKKTKQIIPSTLNPSKVPLNTLKFQKTDNDIKFDIFSLLNESTKSVYQKLGSFRYNVNSVTEEVTSIKPLYLENGAIYIGESLNTERHGKGIQI